ncbi:RagB/SusD family nutrient uptake outer membrane protein [Flavobacterium cellulosilyticum]|uniref:RagB/SusD family nutrient uptake outer membrane protein n=1 Tax=Flavobacterium cellulosilyticum TaxID=2541731 RepID=A0A4V2Z069_9FLAO|nr:RagB/SusD family nutrient uptake outer membrane protein [Flavobacterium cellulosilyticum]TDD99367.1 RagB/SusD family nutrient uptake outer membrane protein [Flavobacterium cellulosilyticum]
MKKYILISWLVLMFATACNDDLLNTQPQTSIPEAIAYSTPEKILAQTNNLYKQLQNQSFYGGRFIVFNEQRADQFGQNDGNAATGSAVWNQNMASTNDFVNNVWSVGYTAINASNILISKMNETNVIPGTLAKNYIAEAKFIRAFCYFSLVQTYAKPYNQDKNALGLPLRLTPITTSGNNDLARSTVDKVYTQILKDLDEAEIDLPLSYSTSLLNASRAKKVTAIALKTRVLLVQNNFEKVIAESQKIVSATAPFQYTGEGLTLKLEASFAGLFGGSYTGSEAIFSIPFANSTTETPAAQFALAYNYVTQPILFLAAAGVASDPALNSSSDARASLIGTNVANQKIVKKFNVTTAPFRDYVPVIRYAEVLLNYAEAAASTNDLATALALLKAVRNRSDPNYLFPVIDVATKEGLIATIQKERDIEFLGEGFRLMDLQRKVQTLPAKKGSIGTAPLVLPSSSNYIWPIPSGELAANKLIVPNP